MKLPRLIPSLLAIAAFSMVHEEETYGQSSIRTLKHTRVPFVGIEVGGWDNNSATPGVGPLAEPESVGTLPAGEENWTPTASFGPTFGSPIVGPPIVSATHEILPGVYKCWKMQPGRITFRSTILAFRAKITALGILREVDATPVLGETTGLDFPVCTFGTGPDAQQFKGQNGKVFCRTPDQETGSFADRPWKRATWTKAKKKKKKRGQFLLP